MGKKVVFILIIFMVCILLPGQTAFNANARWINPEGWKIPDTSRMVKSAESKAFVYGHDETILVETYAPGETPYSLFDKKVGLEDGRYMVYLDWEVRAEIQRVHVYKDQKGNVLLYFINCMLPERVVVNGEDGFHNAGYSSSGTQYILADLDLDGKFESQYTESADFWNDVTLEGIPEYFRTDPERAQASVVYNLLRLKLAGKKIEIPR